MISTFFWTTLLFGLGRGAPSPTATFLRVSDDLESPSTSDIIPNVTATECGIECFKAGFDNCLGFQWKPYELDGQETNSVGATASEDCTRPSIVGSRSYGQCGLLQCVPRPSSLTLAVGSQIYFFRGRGNVTYGSITGKTIILMARVLGNGYVCAHSLHACSAVVQLHMCLAPKNYRMACTYAYRIFDKTKMTHTEAETQCQMDGAKLMPVKNSEEQALLSTQVLYDEGYWIGLTDKEAEGRFVSSDGTVPTYADWDSGQPNNFLKNGEDQDCVMLFQKKWNDNQCSTKLNFICQISFLEL